LPPGRASWREHGPHRQRPLTLGRRLSSWVGRAVLCRRPCLRVLLRVGRWRWRFGSLGSLAQIGTHSARGSCHLPRLALNDGSLAPYGMLRDHEAIFTDATHHNLWQSNARRSSYQRERARPLPHSPRLAPSCARAAPGRMPLRHQVRHWFALARDLGQLSRISRGPSHCLRSFQGWGGRVISFADRSRLERPATFASTQWRKTNRARIFFVRD
jgi:hypothetical protein